MINNVIPINFKDLSETHADSIPVSKDFLRIVRVTKAICEHRNNSWWIQHCLNSGLLSGLISLQEALCLAEEFGLQV